MFDLYIYMKIKKHLDVNPNLYDYSLHKKNMTIEPTYIPKLERLDLNHIARPYSRSKPITMITSVEGKRVNILDIYGISASKSALHLSSSIMDFASKNCADLIEDVSEKNLDKMLEWRELPLNSKCYKIRKYTWDDNRLYFYNSGGSHHFAAAFYIASKLKLPKYLNAKVETIDIDWIALNRELENNVFYIIEKFDIALHNLLSSYSTGYLLFPSPIEQLTFESNENKRNKTVLISINKKLRASKRIIRLFDKKFTRLENFITSLY